VTVLLIGDGVARALDLCRVNSGLIVAKKQPPGPMPEG
jgi:hypothetical protein